MADPLKDWEFDLPQAQIATQPADTRDQSRLMRVHRSGAPLQHLGFRDILGELKAGDLLVLNNVRVMASRLRARRASGGRVEFLLLAPGPGIVPCMAKPARRLKVGETLSVDGGGEITIEALADEQGLLRVSTSPEPAELMERCGELPLPPYMQRAAEAADTERYQTVYAGPLGASAAPTAGLHFTEDLLQELRERGVGVEYVTLYVGIGTFRPLRVEDLERGTLHTEQYVVPAQVAEAHAACRARGGRVIAVGTTSARTLESAFRDGSLHAEATDTNIFIKPPYTFKAVDGLITNFHLPRSSLLMLVASLTSRDRMLAAYAEAVERGYRFYSYGDAMLIL